MNAQQDTYILREQAAPVGLMTPALVETTAPAWSRGCGKCFFGVDARTPFWRGYPSILEMRLAQFKAGSLIFCACDAGQAYQRAIEQFALTYKSDDERTQLAVEQARRRRYERVFSETCVPDRFANLSFADYVRLCAKDPGKAAAIRTVKEYREAGFVMTGLGKRYGLLFYGRTDMGKTGALTPLFLSYVKEGNPGLWVQYNDLLAALKDFHADDDLVEQRIDACKHIEYLYIDDFGDPAADKAATDYARDVVFRIVDYRNNYRKPTFITSNLHPDRLSGQYHERVTKRLAELCAVVELTGIPMRDLLSQSMTQGIKSDMGEHEHVQ